MTKKLRTPEEVVADLAPAYTTLKSSEKEKEKFRKEFFEAITREAASDPPEEEIISIKAKDEAEAIKLAERNLPAVNLTEHIREDPDKPGYWEIIAIADPQYYPYSIEYEGKVWSRQVRSGSTLLDDDRLIEDNPELWDKVTEIPNEKFLLALFEDDDATLYEKIEHIEAVGEKFGIERILKPLEGLEPDLLASIQDYLYEGKPTLVLPAPKKVKDE